MDDYERCRTCQETSPTTEDRYSLGLYAGHMCTPCWRSSGYRDEGPEGFDPADAGETYEAES